MNTPEEFDKAHEALLLTHAGEAIGNTLKAASDAMETGFIAGWNSAMLAVGAPESMALVIRCAHGAALGVEECPGDTHKGVTQ